MKILLQIGHLIKLETEALMDVTEVLRSGESHKTIARGGNSLQMLRGFIFSLISLYLS